LLFNGEGHHVVGDLGRPGMMLRIIRSSRLSPALRRKLCTAADLA
jgi:hypothetical protein